MHINHLKSNYLFIFGVRVCLLSHTFIYIYIYIYIMYELVVRVCVSVQVCVGVYVNHSSIASESDGRGYRCGNSSLRSHQN